MSLELKRAQKDDCDLLYRWYKDEETRKASFNSEAVSYDSHRDWFARSLADTGRFIYIAEDENKNKIGMVRLDKINEAAAELSINIAPEQRGKGYGKSLIDQACLAYPLAAGAILFVAQVKKYNAASVRTFEKAGFRKIIEYANDRLGEILVLGRIKT